MREANTARKTAETEITARIDLDGTGVSKINTGVGFLDHMLTLFAKHGNFDLTAGGADKASSRIRIAGGTVKITADTFHIKIFA